MPSEGFGAFILKAGDLCVWRIKLEQGDGERGVRGLSMLEESGSERRYLN